MATAILTRVGLGPATLAIQDHQGNTILELTYMTNSMAKIALEQISSAFGMAMDDETVRRSVDGGEQTAPSFDTPRPQPK